MLIRIAVATLLAMQLAGCRDNCNAHTSFCNEAQCGVVWDCGDATRELRVTPGTSCECIDGNDAATGTCGADLCNILGDANQRAIREGDSAFDNFDDAVNDACNWNVRTVEPLVLGGCP